MQLGTALNLPNPRINFGGTGRAPGKGNTAIFSFETGVLDSRINFSRTTNATVTNSAGQITYAPHNLLTYSEQFDNAAWTKSQSTITANAVISPDGTNTADKLVETAVNNVHGISVITTGAGANSTSTFSIYAQKAERSKIRVLLTDNATGGVECVFDLNAGTAGAVSVSGNYTSGSALITASTNGFYRCSVIATKNASGNTSNVPIVQLYTTTQTYLGDGTSGAYIWGAQLEIGSTATTYNSTTVKNLLGYSELFDNAAWTKSNSFVQTNLILYSEAFDNAAWAAYGTKTVSANAGIAPNGYQTAEYLNSPFGNGVQQAFSVVATTAYTFSIYAKADTGTSIRIAYTTEGGTVVSNTIDTVISTGESVGNGWYRVSISFTTGIGNTAAAIRILSAAAVGIYIWGAQLVQGSVAGDYRRTDAAALPVYYPNHNGVVCAEKLVESATTSTHFTISANYTTVAGTSYTASTYVYPAGRNFIAAQVDINTGAAGNPTGFNLSTGTVISLGSGVTFASITPAGNGWYRISITATATTSGTNRGFGFALNSTSTSSISSYAGDGTSGVYVFGAQVSDSASLDPYVLNAAAAPTAAAYYGPRFDYDPVTLQPKGLLIEEQRTNLVLHSEDFSNVAWTKDEGTITSNVTTAPDGKLTADLFVPSTVNTSTHRVRQTLVNTAATHAVTVFAKAGGYNWIQIRMASQWINFNLSTGLFGFSSGVTNQLAVAYANGWWKITGTFAVTLTNQLVYVTVCPTDINNITPDSFAGDGVSGVYIWGYQAELGAFATSYIPTAASQVTRAADVATIQGSNFYSWYNQNEGSIVTNASASSNGFTFVSRNSSGDSYVSLINRASNNAFEVYNINVAQASLITSSLISKISGGYKVNDFAASVNNSSVATDTSGTTPLVSYVSLGSFASNSLAINGTIKSISYYPQRLSNEVLKGLTA